MLWIQKGREPKSLTEYRQTPGADYEHCPCRDDIRKALLREQGHLCAYCMRRIYDDPDTTKIEHWYPRALLKTADGQPDYKAHLRYQNMLGVCEGHSGGEAETCDTKKKDIPITVDPRKKEHIEKIAYRIGRNSVDIRSDDEEIHSDLTERLNLNANTLPLNRYRVYKVLLDELTRARKGGWSVAMLEQKRRQYQSRNAQGQLREYAGFLLWWLDREIRKRTP